MVPMAVCAIETLLGDLERPGHNGGPPLQHRQEAIEALRRLHQALSDLLALADRPSFLEGAGEGALVEVARWGQRACETLQGDPMCYAMSGLIFVICAALGAPGLGGMLGAVALTIRDQNDAR
jgi:hypothetical protein